MRKFVTPSNVVLLALAAVALVMLALVVRQSLTPVDGLDSPFPSAAAGASPTSAPRPSSVAFIGDGYTSGAPAGGQGDANYTALTGVRDGWQVTNAAVYGSGYVAGTQLDKQLPTVVSAAPQLVVVSGGRADLDVDPAAVRDAAGRLYRDLPAQLPGVRLVVIGPMWVGQDVPPNMLAVRDAVRDAAGTANLPFVDPIADRWFEGQDADGVSPDGDLNDQGHRRMAQLVSDALERSGVG